MSWNSTFTRLMLFAAMVVYTVLQIALSPHTNDYIALVALMGILPQLLSFYLLRRIAAAQGGAAGRFWLLLSYSSFLYAAALVIYFGLYAAYGSAPPTPNVAEVIWNIQTLLVLVSFSYLLFIKRSIYRGMRYLFDILTFVVVICTFCWYYFVSPGLHALMGNAEWIEYVGITLYPIYDLLVISIVITLFFADRSFLRGWGWMLVVLAILLLLVADTSFMFMAAEQRSFIGSWVAPVYNLSLMLLPLAGLIGLESKSSEALRRRSPSLPDYTQGAQDNRTHPCRQTSVQMYVPVVNLLILIAMAVHQVEHWSSLLIGGFMAVILIVIRQMIVMKENDILMKRSEEMLERYEYMANHDVLSGLPNRRYFEERIRSLLRQQTSEPHVALMMLDMDRFKYANDTYGHMAGDQIICQVAQRLSEVVGSSGIVARQSGDEFAILLECRADHEQLAQWAERIQEAIARPFTLLEHVEYLMSISIGIALAQPSIHEHDLVRHADLALYRAKLQGGSKYAFYEEEMTSSISRQLEMEQALRKAIEQDELLLHYQPQLNAATQEVVGAEALIRWQPKNGSPVSPAVFIPIAEETGLIVPIGDWVTRTACEQAVAWIRQGNKPFLMSVNVSLRQFQEPDFVSKVVGIVRETNIPPEMLVLEITESIAISDEREAVAKLLELKSYGIQIAMDDFGTGYSSLSVLKRYQVDKLKIDQAFVRDIGENEEQSTIIEAILAMAASLKVEVIAEGVETLAQYQFLQARGCGWIQGYYFSRPLPRLEFEQRFIASRAEE